LPGYTLAPDGFSQANVIFGFIFDQSYSVCQLIMPEFLILAGCNGAGKTTAAYTLLPDMLPIKNFVNADEIARGLSPFDVEAVAFEAGRIMLRRIDSLLNDRQDFVIETTLSSKNYGRTIQSAKAAGCVVRLIYVWLESVELAKNRVAARIIKGGHTIPSEVIERRYKRGIQNLVNVYLPICDYAVLIDNSTADLRIIAERIKENSWAVNDNVA
jgi:predicted ABC-type ATPase